MELLIIKWSGRRALNRQPLSKKRACFPAYLIVPPPSPLCQRESGSNTMPQCLSRL